MAKARATIVVPDADDEPTADYHLVVDWLIRWEKGARIVGYDFRDLEHVWDVEGGTDAIGELPRGLLRDSPWVLKGGSGKNRAPVGEMTFSVNKAKRLRNRARRSAGTPEE